MSRRNTFWQEMYASFRKTGGFVLAMLGFALAVWAILFPAPFMVDGRWLLTLGVFAYVVLAALADFGSRAHAAITPAVVVKQAMRIDDQPYLLASPANLFGSDTAVIVCQMSQGFEIEIGVGRAISISNDHVQIAIVDIRQKSDLWERICAGEPGILATLVVRQAVPFNFYQRLVSS